MDSDADLKADLAGRVADGGPAPLTAPGAYAILVVYLIRGLLDSRYP